MRVMPGASTDGKQEIQSTKFAFAALRADGSVVAWGEAGLIGNVFDSRLGFLIKQNSVEIEF